MKAGPNRLPVNDSHQEPRCPSRLTIEDDDGNTFTVRCAYEEHPPAQAHRWTAIWSDLNSDNPVMPPLPAITLADMVQDHEVITKGRLTGVSIDKDGLGRIRIEDKP